MFLVEIRIPHEDRLADEMQAMRAWLDHQKFAPTTFRHTFASPGIVSTVEFTDGTEALDFAKAFGGRLMQPVADTRRA